jgi:hypothetical protein
VRPSLKRRIGSGGNNAERLRFVEADRQKWRISFDFGSVADVGFVGVVGLFHSKKRGDAGVHAHAGDGAKIG